MSRSQEIQVKLTTKIVQDEQVNNHLIENSGTMQINDDRIVIEFWDSNSEGDFLIRFDLLNEGGVLLNRSSKDRQNMSDFYFQEGQEKEVLYKTVYGTTNMVAETQDIKFEIDSNFESGQVEINYRLFNQQELLGEYNLRLIFSV
ncbi:DUF1934 domain-containing protein [Lactobacillus sp. YT155]|uniref:DUF1934 domain-containing protein n=1 Tax=Lactobacillus sp. YT155 TaxID=3060955 RepID=UPI00265EFCD2|nr:DUF1934 domain-containing protein [Lactobacillus sp. YT155]MDO1604611.1 DUF1934 domain-containing protein [Lactobacillus sp. YT155]